MAQTGTHPHLSLQYVRRQRLLNALTRIEEKIETDFDSQSSLEDE